MEYTIISNCAEKQTLVVEDDMLVSDVRGIIEAMIGAPDNVVVNISYKGKLLTDGSEVWGDVISVIDGPTASSAQPSVPRKLFCHVTRQIKVESGSAEALRALMPDREEKKAMENEERRKAQMMAPLVEAMSKNPQLTDMMLSSQPGVKKLLEKNPEASKMLKDPETMNELLMSQLDPDKRRELSRTLNLQMAQISALPGGQQMLDDAMYRANHQIDSVVTRDENDLHTTSEESVRPRDDRDANREAIPDPWSRPQATTAAPAMGGFGNMNAFSQMFGGGGGGAPAIGNGAGAAGIGGGGGANMFNPFLNFGGGNNAPAWNWGVPLGTQPPQNAATGVVVAPPPPSQTPPGSVEKPLTEAEKRELLEKYSAELSVLAEMGFEDREQSLEALIVSNGDVEAAVDYIGDLQNQ